MPPKQASAKPPRASRITERRADRSLRVVLIGALALLTVALPTTPPAGRASAEAASLTLHAGLGDFQLQINEFLPGNVTIARGDTLTWEGWWSQEHTVTFGTPTADPGLPTHAGQGVIAYDGSGFVSSGILFSREEQPRFSMRFDAGPGVYSYFCNFHPNMTGTVTVAADTSARDEQETVDAGVEAGRSQAVRELFEAFIDARENLAGTTVTRTSGTRQVIIEAGVSTDSGHYLGYILPSDFAGLRVGDTVVFRNHDVLAHTATGPSNSHVSQFISDLLAAYGDVQSVPPRSLQPSDGEGAFWHTGILPPGGEFELTVYRLSIQGFYCMIHGYQGMQGGFEVQLPPPGAPATGTGLAPAESAGSRGVPPLVAGVAILILAGGTAAVAAIRRPRQT